MSKKEADQRKGLMEIDLNHALNEGEKNGCCNNGKCNKNGCACCSLSTSTNSSCSSNGSSATEPSSIFKELWHACAGPLTTLPTKGNVVVYFPQGHLEQAASVSPYAPLDVPSFSLPPQIFCKVVDIQLLANKENDEVYTQLTLLPVSEVELQSEANECKELKADEERSGVTRIKSTSHMFCKTLTASDTSTHGGFSVPRRAAEDCFPPLDYKEQRPSQELVAKDLHGVEWKFRHIYRGQPRRHLLTTGWSIFVSQKNLVSGDAVLFLREDGGELRLGIRRAARPRNGLPDSVIKNQHSYPNILAPVANAISCKRTFNVFYSPRGSHADFIVPHSKYVKSISHQIPMGTRFKMRFDLDDTPERRFSGVVTGLGDLDPFRWPYSKWRCLAVRWDEDIMSSHQERVCPWEIDFPVPFPPLGIQSSPRMKKLRTCLQSSPHVSSIAATGSSLLDFVESTRSTKVLQGQENGSISPLITCDTMNHLPEFDSHHVAHQNSGLNGIETTGYSSLFRSQTPTPYTGFTDSNRFPKVLQGQEICSLRSLTNKAEANIGTNVLNVYQGPKTNYYPLASEGARNPFFPYDRIYKSGQDPALLSYVANLQRQSHVLNSVPLRNERPSSEGGICHFTTEKMPQDSASMFPIAETHFKNKEDGNNNNNGMGSACKLFGFSLSKEPHTTNSQCPNRRSCTKVHKQGSLVGRAIDLSRLNSYADLFTELEILFSMEGLLRDPNKGWRILYTDSENDMMVVGDDPWNEFCEVVSKIHLYTQEEVERMTIGIISDDTQSCLEEAPPMADVSKSPSVGQPDSSSPTIARI